MNDKEKIKKLEREIRVLKHAAGFDEWERRGMVVMPDHTNNGRGFMAYDANGHGYKVR